MSKERKPFPLVKQVLFACSTSKQITISYVYKRLCKSYIHAWQTTHVNTKVPENLLGYIIVVNLRGGVCVKENCYFLEISLYTM